MATFTAPTIIIAALAVAAVVAWIYTSIRNRNENSAAIELKPIDLVAFARVLQPGDDRAIRECLGHSDYVIARRMRIRACIDYMKRARFNAVVLHRLGQRAIRAGDAAMVRDAQRLLLLAGRIRKEAMLAVIVLRLMLWLPMLSVPFLSIPDRHAELCYLGSAFVHQRL